MSAKKIKKVKTMPSSVCRVNKNANYTVMSNYHLRSTNPQSESNRASE